MTELRAVLVVAAILALGCNDLISAGQEFAPTWESLKTHQEPDWFRDAKFGIYTHWGPITVATEDAPAEMEWYARQLYQTNHAAFKYHRQRFGDQHQIGYKDVIPRFKAEKFNADEWAELFARAGARFAGPVAIHHDHYANWDSAITRWNSQAIGPKRDLTGELAQALRKRGLKFMTSFHHGFAWRYYEPAYQFDAADPQYSDLYGEPHQPGAPPSRRFQDTWLALVNEVMRKYRPDLIWFDFELGSVITPEYQRRMFADVYNSAARTGREIGVTHKHREIHQYTGILDFERGREDRLTEYVWLTDTSIGPWFHHNCLPYRPVGELVDILVDIVAKNGCLLLNVGPQADGRIPAAAQQMLLALGDWLKINGEAIYGTRHWLVFGEGPTRNKGGGFSEGRDRPFTAQDIRFTTKGDTLYAIVLDWPPGGKVTVRSLASAAGKVTRISMLGQGGDLNWSQTADSLEVNLPARPSCKYAFSLKIIGAALKPAPLPKPDTSLRPAADGSVLLEPGTAELHGSKIRVENRQDHDYLAAWDNANEWASWNMTFSVKAEYEISIVCSAGYADTEFSLELAGQKLTGTARKTKGWYDYQTLSLGKVQIPQPGACDLHLRPRDPSKWKAMNVRSIKLSKAESPTSGEAGGLK